ncbi:MAG: T9SS type A sorting domain-containing protein [Ignavibacteria bacterium]|nr:T9SS type A sorting domain-containing protein [Ignavibacteria bacterium]
MDTRLKGCIIDGLVCGILLSAGRPSAECAFALQQCYPNPPAASSDITIPFFTPHRTGHIELRLYDALGRECATLADGLNTQAASIRISFSVRSLSRGDYYYRLQLRRVKRGEPCCSSEGGNDSAEKVALPNHTCMLL